MKSAAVITGNIMMSGPSPTAAGKPNSSVASKVWRLLTHALFELLGTCMDETIKHQSIGTSFLGRAEQAARQAGITLE